jgi:hypothetical protein
VTLGDSLTAEYEEIAPIAGFEEEATAYARVDRDPTTKKLIGGVSRSWVEILGLTRSFFFDFGFYRTNGTLPRLDGFTRNWGIPGAKASQYEEFMTTSFNANPFFFTIRLPLEQQLSNNTDRVVIWLGTNDLRERYGEIYDGDTEAVEELKEGLLDDLKSIIDRVQDLNDDIEIVVGNLPDLAAAPSIVADFDVEADRELVTEAVEEINEAIAELAEEEDIGVADVYAITKKLVEGEPFYFGGVQFAPSIYDELGEVLEPAEHNDPHFLFTRDGFHPNTALQVQIARTFIKAFNDTYDAEIPLVTHAEALKLLKINPREPYLHWINSFDPAVDAEERGLLKNPDGDDLTNLIEYALDSDPRATTTKESLFEIGGPVEGINSEFSVHYTLPEVLRREVDIAVQYKIGTRWFRVPAERVVTDEETGIVEVAIPFTTPNVPLPLRIKVTLVPPQGATNTVSSIIKLGEIIPGNTPVEPSEP